MTKFDPRRARAKQPCPIWFDAFLRDTEHLSADEIGAYVLLLGAMWRRVECDFPDDDMRLARVCRVSLRLWKSRVGPVLRAFLRAEKGALISERLRKEAAYCERRCKAQSDRKSGNYSHNMPEYNETWSSTDVSTDATAEPSPDQPTYIPTVEEDTDAKASAPSSVPRMPPPTFRERILTALRADPVSGMIGPNGRMLGTPADMAIAARWLQLGLTEGEIVAVVEASVARARMAPRSFSYFDGPMADLAAAKAQPPPDIPAAPPRHSSHGDSDHAARQSRIIAAAIHGTTRPAGAESAGDPEPVLARRARQ